MPTPYNRNFGPLNPAGPTAPLFGNRPRPGAAPRRVLLVGHSHIAGFGSSGSVTGGLNAAKNNLGVNFVKALAGYGVSAKVHGFMGDYSAPSVSLSLNQVDPRITQDAGWTILGSKTLGGNLIRADAGGGFMTFKPGFKFKRFRLWHYRGSAGSVSVWADGQKVTTIDLLGTPGTAAVDFSVPGSEIALKNEHATNVAYIEGIEAFPQEDVDVTVLSAGSIGGIISDMVDKTNAWNSGNVINLYKPDLGVIYILTNDLNAATAVATWKASLEVAVKDIMANGRCIIVIDPAGSGSPFTSGTIYADYAEAVNSVAARYGATVLDMRQAFGGTHAQATLRKLQFDSQHPNAAGYELAGQFLAAKAMGH